MPNSFKHLARAFRVRSQADKELEKQLRLIVGYTPFNLNVYKLALLHSSASKENSMGVKESNERLEYLGDAILGSIVAEYLFKKYPFKDEGWLTEIRSRIVNRETLNMLAGKLGIGNLIHSHKRLKKNPLHRSIYGNALEAVIAAVFMDRDYKYCRRFILTKIIPFLDLKEVIEKTTNFKSRILEWAQKEGKEVRFDTISVDENKNIKEFTVQLYVDNKPVGKGLGKNKKKAEQQAARKSCEILDLM